MGVNANDVVAAAPASSPSTDGAVKYRLVEAEEVSNKAQMPSQQQQPRGAKPKRKGKLNWSQFPLEGEEEEELQAMAKSSSTAPVAETAPASNNGDSRSRGHFQSRGRGGRGPRGGRFGGHRPQYDNNGTYYNGVYVPNPDIQVSAQWAKNQIEFYFTSDNLVRDIFMRQHMDVDGFVPLAFVGSFQAVYSVHQDYESLLEVMKHSETVELDEQNEKIRLRDGWQKWVWPNAEGGYGVPRYIKAEEEPSPADASKA